jgi:hypothetical protein
MHSAILWDGDPLDQHDRKGDKIKDDTDIESSQHLVKDPCHFVEQSSLAKFDIISCLHALRGVVHDLLQFVAFERLEVHVRDLHDHLQGNEMDDAVLNCVLISQHENVNELTQEGCHNLQKSKEIRNLSS